MTLQMVPRAVLKGGLRASGAVGCVGGDIEPSENATSEQQGEDEVAHFELEMAWPW